jgi:uncharacterized membrane protein
VAISNQNAPNKRVHRSPNQKVRTRQNEQQTAGVPAFPLPDTTGSAICLSAAPIMSWRGIEPDSIGINPRKAGAPSSEQSLMFDTLASPVTSRAMDEAAAQLASSVATAIEAVMVVVIIIGSVRAAAALVRLLATRKALAPAVREIWLHYAAWILLALEFALAADIIRTIVRPDWNDIGQLGAIATIRIALSYFLGRDIGEVEGSEGATATSDGNSAAS